MGIVDRDLIFHNRKIDTVRRSELDDVADNVTGDFSHRRIFLGNLYVEFL